MSTWPTSAWPTSAWPRAVLFDFDGVIVDSEPLHCRGFQRVLADEAGITLTDADYYRHLIGFDDRGAFAHIFAVHGRPLDAATARRLEAAKAAVVQGMIDGGEFTALPGVDDLVRGLAPHYPLAICSGALRPEIERMLDGIGLRPFFPVVVAAEDVAVGKPDPSGYLLTVGQLSAHAGVPLTPADCLVIEDAPTVIRAVRAVGFSALGVATSHPIEALSAANHAVRRLTPGEVTAVIPQLKVGA